MSNKDFSLYTVYLSRASGITRKKRRNYAGFFGELRGKNSKLRGKLRGMTSYFLKVFFNKHILYQSVLPRARRPWRTATLEFVCAALAIFKVRIIICLIKKYVFKNKINKNH